MEIRSQSEPTITVGMQELYRCCCSDDPTVRDAAFAQLGQFLLRVAFARLHGQPGLKQTAEDCTQQALHTVWQKLSAGNGPTYIEGFMSWCASIVIHKVLDELRKVQRSRACSLEEQAEEDDDWLLQLSDPNSPAPDKQTVEIESTAELVNLIQDHPQLTPEAKFILLYGYLLEWSDDALANQLGKQRSTIRVLRFRALQILRGDPGFMQSLAAIAPFALDSGDSRSQN